MISRILGILTYALMLLGFASWAVFDIGANLTITLLFSTVVLFADRDAVDGMNALKQRGIDWKAKLIPPLIAMHAGLLLLILSSFYYLGPLTLVSFFLVAFGAVPILSRPQLPEQRIQGFSANWKVTIVGAWIVATTCVIMVFVFRSSIFLIAKFVILAAAAGFLIAIVAALLRREKALERKIAQDAVRRTADEFR